jgi:hypothetical protein
MGWTIWVSVPGRCKVSWVTLEPTPAPIWWVLCPRVENDHFHLVPRSRKTELYSIPHMCLYGMQKENFISCCRTEEVRRRSWFGRSFCFWKRCLSFHLGKVKLNTNVHSQNISLTAEVWVLFIPNLYEFV